jgi:acyl-CoA thioesterase-2
LADLLSLLELERVGEDSFLGPNPVFWPGGRVFGGLVAGQALRAATHTVEVDHHVHSMHAYFVRPGVPGEPITMQVARIRDGRSFTTRNVLAIQGDETIFSMSASFQRDEEGEEYQLPMAMDVPRPDDTPRPEFMPRVMGGMDMREIGPTPPAPDGTYRSTRRVWMRVTADLPDDPDVHASVIAFMSDMGVVMAARPPSQGHDWRTMMGASLDHALWFHRRIRADDWLLYDLHSLSTSNARGLVRGTMHTADGVLGVSVTQEALIRTARPGTPKPTWEPGPES